MTRKDFDFLVVGGGVAGLTFALKVADYGTVAVLFKKALTQSSTAWAQGGVAAVSHASDSFDLHVQDTLQAGAGLCHSDRVQLLVEEGPARIKELINLGAGFDTFKDDEFHLHQEGGHSVRRIFHAADATGYEIQKTLLTASKAHPNIQFFENTFAVDLITTHKLGEERSDPNRVLGAYVLLNDQVVEAFVAKKTLIATGGIGKVYLYTSNPDVSTGDGIAMCCRAGASIANMEFMQFHPTCLFHPQAKTFLITEAMRGEGAKLRRINGESFMDAIDQRAELASRDIVARAIDYQMKLYGEDHVHLDISHRSPEFVKEHFPTIYERCRSYGFDITKGPIPVVPAAHYCCGGVVSNEHGQSEIADLYVAGECAHTGVHGANRLASNSLLEGMVFADRAANHAIQDLAAREVYSIPRWDPGEATDSDEEVIITQNWDEIRRFMWNYVGIVRSTKRLERAKHRNQLIRDEINEYYWNFHVTADLLELRNLNLVADLVIESAMRRKESRGLHYTLDYPDTKEEYMKDTVVTFDDLF